MGIGKGITDFLGAFAESAMGSDSKSAGVLTDSGNSKSSDSRGGNSGSSSVDSAGITETRDSWGNPISHSVKICGVDKIYPAGMMGWIESLTGGQPVATIEHVGDRSTYKTSDGNTIASGIRQSDGSERIFDGNGTFIREVTPVEIKQLNHVANTDDHSGNFGNGISGYGESRTNASPITFTIFICIFAFIAFIFFVSGKTGNRTNSSGIVHAPAATPPMKARVETKVDPIIQQQARNVLSGNATVDNNGALHYRNTQKPIPKTTHVYTSSETQHLAKDVLDGKVSVDEQGNATKIK